MTQAETCRDRYAPSALARHLLDPWFASLGWTPRPFQRQTWDAYAAGESGLIHVPTGAGKTYAAYGGPLADLIAEARSEGKVAGPRVLYVTPLRAVSRDIAKAMRAPLADLGLLDEAVTVETRTGDTSTAVRARQKQRLPNVLITTPESLTLLLTRPETAKGFAGLRAVIVDEWHELLASKRGTQTELALARLRRLAPAVRTWALSATLRNLDEAAAAAVGGQDTPTVISAEIERPVIIESVLPAEGDPFPWAGHLGLAQLPGVLDAIETDDQGQPVHSTLIFVNTRSQAERWHHALHAAKPDWARVLALHHGSIDRAERERVEQGLKEGTIKLVVATSSLDLGVDFAPVECVMQIGSPKGIARLMQRAGRASHRPGAPCRIVCVPTHALEMVEVAAVRRAIEAGQIEPRSGESKPLDVLAQHMVSMALGGGFDPDELYAEVVTTRAYRDLTRDEFDWALDLVTRGGETLKAYPEYRKVLPNDEGKLSVPDRRVAQLHRLNVGTITGDATMDLRFLNGKRIGSIEENFINNLREGQKFVFAGRTLAFRFTKDLTAYVRPGDGPHEPHADLVGHEAPDLGEPLGRGPARRRGGPRRRSSTPRPSPSSPPRARSSRRRPVSAGSRPRARRWSRSPTPARDDTSSSTPSRAGSFTAGSPPSSRSGSADAARGPSASPATTTASSCSPLTPIPFDELLGRELFSADQPRGGRGRERQPLGARPRQVPRGGPRRRAWSSRATRGRSVGPHSSKRGPA